MLVHSPSSRMHLCTSRTFWNPVSLVLTAQYIFSLYVLHSCFTLDISVPQRAPFFLSLRGAHPLLFDGFLTLQVHYSNRITHFIKHILIYPTILNFHFLYCSLTVIDHLTTYYTRFVGTKNIICT